MRDWVNRIIARIGIDKIAHFAFSAFLCLAIGRFLNWWIAVIITAALGIIKELIDKLEGGKIDFKDILADAIGVVVGMMLLLI